MGLSSTTFKLASKAAEFGRMTQNNGITPFKVIQGHRYWYQCDFLLVISSRTSFRKKLKTHLFSLT